VYNADGQLLTATLMDYALQAADLHRSRWHLETPSPSCRGVKGLGEGGTIGAPATIANAVADAVAISARGSNEASNSPECFSGAPKARADGRHEDLDMESRISTSPRVKLHRSRRSARARLNGADLEPYGSYKARSAGRRSSRDASPDGRSCS